MTRAGQLYENPQTGERMRFLETAQETGGLRLTIEFWLQPYTNRDVPGHFHQMIEEQFEILSGPVRYRLGKSEFAANPGEVVVLPPAVPHVHPWATSEWGRTCGRRCC